MKLESAICSTESTSTRGEHKSTAAGEADQQSFWYAKETCRVRAFCYRRLRQHKAESQSMQYHPRGDYLAVQCYCSWDSRALWQLSWPPIQTWNHPAACSEYQTPPTRNQLLQYRFHYCCLEVLPSSDWPVKQRVLTARRQAAPHTVVL